MSSFAIFVFAVAIVAVVFVVVVTIVAATATATGTAATATAATTTAAAATATAATATRHYPAGRVCDLPPEQLHGKDSWRKEVFQRDAWQRLWREEETVLKQQLTLFAHPGTVMDCMLHNRPSRRRSPRSRHAQTVVRPPCTD